MNTCEKCASEFAYQLTRIGVGKSSSPYGIAKKAAQARAEKKAKKNLATRLDRDVELVPCPACRWVNADAVRVFRKTRYKNFDALISVTIIFALGLEAFLYFDSDNIFNRVPSIAAPELWIVLAISLALVGSLKVLQITLRKRIDPNVLINGLPSVPPGTPPALIKEIGPDGAERWSPVPSEFSNLQGDAVWATFRPGQLVLEPLCHNCLAPATTVYKLPMTVSKTMSIPACTDCLRCAKKILDMEFCRESLRDRGWRDLRRPHHQRRCHRPRDYGRLHRRIPRRRRIHHHRSETAPYRIRSVDASRGIQKISFRNPAYTALLIRRIGQADGLFEK